MRQNRNPLARRLAWGACASLAALLVGRAAVRRARYMSLRGRTVLITGGSRGLGFALAGEALRRGARVALCARDEEELSMARHKLQFRACRDGADNILSVQCDVTSAAQVEGMVEGVIRHFGGIDVLINNAGMISVTPFEHVTAEDFERAMQVHFSGPLYATLAVLPWMRMKRSGRIVNITSIGGKVAAPHLVAYCASKHALVGFSESLRTEVTKDGVYVTTVVPGFMRTGSPRNIELKGQHDREYAWFVTADVLPLVSIGAERAARRILNAACHGQAEVMLPWTTQLVSRLHGLLPGLSQEFGALANAVLPGPGGNAQVARGSDAQSLVPEFARRRDQRAAEAHNELIAVALRMPPPGAAP